ncbi:hypothetical protein OU798_04725 [Prolixibacteraceae bacterium Z1-6]|uniref:Uncharacterized protein n=1 Tax=Draconibacterium aestuarii TaxID=2998507 RepID=A0A9X3F4H7_9BACT|nr:hypothetical protein [Prolixibacteraceae bacterium Z1-6]
MLKKEDAPVGNLPLPYPCEMPKVMPKPLLQGYESTKMVKKLPLYRYESSLLETAKLL